jgi:enoyl-CoA hydratase/3-hydroxyacyl-CoA dehydrogenase
MALSVFGRTLQRIAVVGSGNLGPDLALYLSRALAPHGVPVVLHDVFNGALEAGRERIVRKLGRATESGVFRFAEAQEILSNLSFTLDKSLLHGCGLVIEAAVERLDVKQAIFEELERIAAPGAILASSSSHFEPERIFERLRRPERAMIHHFFYPAERNPLVELVDGPGCQVADWSAKFYESIGKVPVRVKSRFGYSVNPVFEGLAQAALQLEEQGFSAPIIDAIACRTLGLTAGPFGVMNALGGAPVLQAALDEYGRSVMPWFKAPDSLNERAAAGLPWRTADKGETASYSNAMFDQVSSQILGAYFGLVLEVLESGIASLGDLSLAVELGLAIKPPFQLMNDLGFKRVRELVQAYAQANPGFRVPKDFGPWDVPQIAREDEGDVAVVKIRRPRALNTLNRDVYRQLDREFAAIKADPRVKGVVLTGFGTKAFSAGADLEAVAALPGPEEARKHAEGVHAVLRRIETLGKPVVAALNGISLGAGSELAYACTARVARKGIPLLFGQPEVRMGLIPSSGATQRLPRLIDFPTAWRILRTGGSLSGEDALRLGLIREEVEGDLVARAAELARSLPPAPPAEARLPAVLPDTDLGGLSRRVDEILRRAILDGAQLPFDRALEAECRAFGEVWATRDRRIGLDNYLRTNLKQPAAFVHA